MAWQPEKPNTEKISSSQAEQVLRGLANEQQILRDWSESKTPSVQVVAELRNRQPSLSREQKQVLQVWAEANLQVPSMDLVKLFSDLSVATPQQNLSE